MTRGQVGEASGRSPAQATKARERMGQWFGVFLRPQMKLCLHCVREESAVFEILVSFGARFFSVQFNTGLALSIYLFRTWRT